MFSLSDVTMMACSSAVVLTVFFTFMRYIRLKHAPRLIPARARGYSMQFWSSAEPDSSEAAKLIEWARRPSQCTHYLGYLERLPRTKSIPNGCLECHKIVKCLGSWKKLASKN